MLPIALALAQFAPMLAGVLAGPKAEEVASKVVDIAQQVTGQDTPEKALDVIQRDPQRALEFQIKVVDSEVELTRIYADLDKARLADVKDARGRDVELQKSGYHNTRADLMVLLDVVGLIACLVVIAVFKAQLPGEVVGLLTAIAANFGSCLRDAHQFEFGSSRSSREKDVTLASIAKG